MHRGNRHSSSASAGLRFSSQATASNALPTTQQRPASEPGDTQNFRDLGSDEEWQPNYGSDSDVDVDDPESQNVDEQLPNIDNQYVQQQQQQQQSITKKQRDNQDEEVSFRWENEDEETFVDDVRHTTFSNSTHPHNIPQDSSDDALPLPSDPYYVQSPKSSASSQLHIVATMAATNLTNNQPISSTTNTKINSSTQLHDEYDLDECDQLPVIPGYNGVVKKTSSTSALTKMQNSSKNQSTTTRPILWADRPRDNNTATTTPAVTPATDSASARGSPANVRTSRPGSDSGLSSHGGSSSALRLSTRTSSETSDGSRKAPKSVSFLTQSNHPSKNEKHTQLSTSLSATNISEQSDELAPTSAFVTPQTAAPISPPPRGLGSNRSSGSLKLSERRVSGLRMSLRDGKARLGGGRLSASKRHQRRAAAHEKAASQELGSDFMNSLQGHPSVDRRGSGSFPVSTMDTFSSTRTMGSTITNTFDSQSLSNTGVNQAPGTSLQQGSGNCNDNRFSSKSDGGQYYRQKSGISPTSSNSDRPLSTPIRATAANTLDNSSSMVRATHGGSVKNDPYSFHGGLSRSTTHRQKVVGNSEYRDPTPETPREQSFLECVVDLLKGMTVLRRKNFMSASEVQIWLTSNMQAVQFKGCKKGHAPVITTLDLSRVRKLHVKGSDKELSIEMIDERKTIDFIFPSREKADIWVSGLCCLVPSYANVKARNRRLEFRDNYDPLLDSWNGKPLSSRKRLNEYVLLGSIGQGSFGKVKLALSAADRQFYAVKVLSKAMMRKRMRTVPFDRGLQDTVNPSQLTVTDVNEIVVMKELDHENVMKMQGVFDVTDEDRLYIVVEFLAKGPIMSSTKLFGATPLSEDRARSAFVDVLAGLEYLHHNNIVHRDIKPDNLLEAGDGTVKISDFGAAMLYKGNEQSDQDELRSFSNTVGTPAFTAPELCMNDKGPPAPSRCFAADIWSLGATLFYLVYGRAPFIARSVFEMYDFICTRELEFPDIPAVSKSLQNLIRDLLEKTPEKRASYGDILRSPWLMENVEIAEKLDKLRAALLSHSQERNGNM